MTETRNVLEYKSQAWADEAGAEEAAAWLVLYFRAGSTTIAVAGGQFAGRVLAMLAFFPILLIRITLATTEGRRVSQGHGSSNTGRFRRAFDGRNGKNAVDMTPDALTIQAPVARRRRDLPDLACAKQTRLFCAEDARCTAIDVASRDGSGGLGPLFAAVQRPFSVHWGKAA